MMKEVVVQLAPGVGPATVTSQHRSPFATAKRFGLILQAIHPRSDDPNLSRWYRAEIENNKATEFLQTLRDIPEVTAAYVKPPAEPP
jgi:hypothetical protein